MGARLRKTVGVVEEWRGGTGKEKSEREEERDNNVMIWTM